MVTWRRKICSAAIPRFRKLMRHCGGYYRRQLQVFHFASSASLIPCIVRHRSRLQGLASCSRSRGFPSDHCIRAEHAGHGNLEQASTSDHVELTKSFPAHSSDFRELCYSVVELLLDITGQPHWHATVFARNPQSFGSGQLELQRVASAGASTFERRDSSLLLGSSINAELSLINAQVVELPDGGIVLPLANDEFLVGLLFLEEAPIPSAESLADLTAKTLSDTDALARNGRHGASQVLGQEGLNRLKRVAKILALACSLDQRAALERARDAASRRQIGGIVEQVRGPLSALRTLGAMLVPRTQDINRDVADGIVVQGNRLQDLVAELQAALKPVVPSQPSSQPLAQRQLQRYTDQETCYVPDVVMSVSNRMASTLDNVGVRLVIDPVVTTFEGHASSNSSASCTSSPGSTSSRRTNSSSSQQRNQSKPRSTASIAAGQYADSMPGAQAAGALKQRPHNQQHNNAGAGGSLRGSLQNPQKKEDGPVLLPPPRVSRLLKNPVLTDAEQLVANAPAMAVQDIMSCLIDSALQRTPRGGTVHVSMRTADGGVVVDMTDDGTEMAERFESIVQQTDSSQQAADGQGDLPCTSAEAAMQRIWQGQPPGSGILGLAVAQNRASDVGGRIHVKPRRTSGLVQGITISLWLPGVS